MNVQTIIRNVRPTAQILREDLADSVRSHIRPAHLELTDQEQSCVATLRRDGFAVVQDYWTREQALQMRARLEAYLTEGKSQDFENGAYLRFWDDKAYDEGVRRIYHAERLVAELKAFRNDPFIFRAATTYYGVPFYSGVLTYQHNTRSNANTRYYHVDWFGKQFKAFLYLDDVDKGNGPFTYLLGTHRSYFIRLKKQIVGNTEGTPTSFYENDLKSVLKHEVQICGPAGTLILADVRGIHRGSPQVNRSRSALVNYMYKIPGDVFIDK